MKFNKFFLVVAVVGFATAVSASAAHYEVDAAHSEVGFKVRHLVSKTPGSFKEFEGAFDFDEKHPATGKVTFKVKTASVYTNNDKRDEHLRSADFFEVDKHPEMTFVSKSVKAVGGKKYKVTGDLTLRGVAKPVTFDVEYGGTAKDPWGNTKAGFAATGKINRKDFGMVWNKALDAGGLVLGEDVEISLNIEAQQK